MTGTDPRIVLTTASNIDDARRLGRTLVEERLAACATLIPAVESIYRWQGAVESAAECVLLLKTVAAQLPAREARLSMTALASGGQRTPVPLQRWHLTTFSPFFSSPLPSQFLHFCFFLMLGPFSLAMLASWRRVAQASP